MTAFLQRQINDEPSSPQFMFDVIFGVVIPLISVAVDRNTLGGLISDSPVFSYLPITIGVLTLVLWLFLDKKINLFWNGFISGVLLSGAIYVCIIALLVLYFTILMLALSLGAGNSNLFVIGLTILGLVPVLTAFVYFRNGIRAFLRAYPQISKIYLFESCVFSICVIGVLTAIPYMTQLGDF